MRWLRRRHDDDFSDEIRAHIALETDRFIAEGFPPAEARARAHRAFGNVARVRERYYDSGRFVWISQLVQDVRYAWRGLASSRAFVATSVLTLAVGLGLITAVFTVFSAYLLRPFAVRDPYSLYSIAWRAQQAGGTAFRWNDYQDLAARRDLFDGVVAECTQGLAANQQRLAAAFVSGNYFDVLGPEIQIGRALSADDARAPGGEPVAVLSHQAWTRLFDRDPTVLGRVIEAGGRKLTIVGVLGPRFTGLDDSPRDIWIPVTMRGAFSTADLFGPGQARQLRLTARLRPGVTAQQVQGSVALQPFETWVAGRVDEVRALVRPRSTPSELTLEGVAVFSPIVAAFVLVLVTACANASNVMLARANARHREIGIRLSIGASRARVVRQLLTEGLMIALVAGLAGLALAAALRAAGVWLFLELLPPSVAARVRMVPLDMDQRVFLFALAAAGIATVMFALLPALQVTRLSLIDAVRGQATGAIRSSTLRNVLVVGQIAVSLGLLVVAVTLVRNGAALRSVDLGMTTADVISVRPGPRDSALMARADTVLREDPRVEHVVVTDRNPMFGNAPNVVIPRPAGYVFAAYRFVSPEYFAMLQVPILRGRGFTPAEAEQEAPVAIVSAAGAQVLWPGEDPLGKTIRLGIGPPAPRVRPGDTRADMTVQLRRLGDDDANALQVMIVGVAGDAINGFVYSGKDPAAFYLPTSARGVRAQALMVKSRFPGMHHGEVRTLLQRVHPDAMTFDVLPIDEMVALQMFPLRAAAWIGSLLAGAALALSISGLYGVLSYTFSQRVAEIGIRMALGADFAAIRRLVFAESARLASIGAAVGAGAAFTIMKLLSTVVRLDNVKIVDPVSFALSVGLVAAAVMLAASAPARRAARVDPSQMFRTEA